MVHIDSKDLHKNIQSAEEARDANVLDAWVCLMRDMEVLAREVID
jgi:hypothetical protein